MERRELRISVIGLGKLGAPLAAVLAHKGYDVVGADVSAGAVAALNDGRAPVPEPGLQDMVTSGRARLAATTDLSDAVARSDITFIIVPTPSDSDGRFSNAHVISAMRKIGAALKTKRSYHVVSVTSTVMPGSTEGPIRQALMQAAGDDAEQRIGLCYNPEFIALGSVIHDMLHPDFVLIGESDRRAGDVLEKIYETICENKPPIRRMTIVNAELTKIAVNTYVTAKISFANMLSDICDRLPGADASVVTAALGHDTRIGPKYLKPGLGYAGPCFPRDNAALVAMARALGARADLAEATDSINRRQPHRIVKLTRSLLAHGTVGILGLSYKPSTGVVEESQGVEAAALLAKAGYRVVVYDPQGLEAAMSKLGAQVEAVPDAESCARAADVLLITTPWPEFRDLPEQAIRRPRKRLQIIDCWHLLPADRMAALADIVYLGSGRSDLPDPAEQPTARLLDAGAS